MESVKIPNQSSLQFHVTSQTTMKRAHVRIIPSRFQPRVVLRLSISQPAYQTSKIGYSSLAMLSVLCVCCTSVLTSRLSLMGPEGWGHATTTDTISGHHGSNRMRAQNTGSNRAPNAVKQQTCFFCFLVFRFLNVIMFFRGFNYSQMVNS